MSRKNVIISAFWLLLGAVLLLCGIFDLVDSYWSGMGGAFLTVGDWQQFDWISRFLESEISIDVQIFSTSE